MDQRTVDAAAIEAEVDRVRSLGIDALRKRWRMTFGAAPPPGLTKDIMGRMIAYRIQEEAFGVSTGNPRKCRGFSHEAETPHRLQLQAAETFSGLRSQRKHWLGQ